jgi:hypothetical protein
MKNSNFALSGLQLPTPPPIRDYGANMETPCHGRTRVKQPTPTASIGSAMHSGTGEICIHSLENLLRSIHFLEKMSAGTQDPEIAFNLASARTNAGRVFEARGDFACAGAYIKQCNRPSKY